MTTTSTQTFKKTPANFSFQRLLMTTDGGFFNQIAGSYEHNPLQVVRHGIRGTQNTETSGKDVSNIQQTESAKTDAAAEALVVRFGMRLIDLEHGLFACIGDTPDITRQVRDSVQNFVQRAKTSQGLITVSERIARNVMAGAWLWRNRSVASAVEVEVAHKDAVIAKVDALKIPTNRFDDLSAEEKAVGAVIAAGLRGDRQANLTVVARLRFGVSGCVEVFPSQAYLEDKPKGFARPLYKISRAAKADDTSSARDMGQAALRDQKIANRLRTIDTWYPGFEEIGQPLPIEPNGASLEFAFAFRGEKAVSAFDMFARLNAIDPNSDEGMFCIGVLIRGGVLGMSGKAKPGKAGEPGETGAAEAAEASEA